MKEDSAALRSLVQPRTALLFLVLFVVALSAGRRLIEERKDRGSEAEESRLVWQGHDVPKLVDWQETWATLKLRGSGIGRDPFRFAQMTVVAAQVPVLIEAEVHKAESQVDTKQPERPPAPTGPMVDWRYLGSFGPERLPVAAFSRGDEVEVATVGGVLDSRFIVRSITRGSVDFGLIDRPEGQVIRLLLSDQ
nr:hypothetical protein [uncultured bacterium]